MAGTRIGGPWRALRLALKAIRPLEEVPDIADLDAALRPFHATTTGRGATATLDLGCGDRPRNPFGATEVHGVDIREHASPAIRAADLTVEPIPFASGAFDFLTAYDFIEHVPRVVYAPARRFAFVELMNEVHRVLKPDGLFLSRTPIYPFAHAYRDPTHVNLITCDTFPLYFDCEKRWASMYGFTGSFEVLLQGLQGAYLVSVLQRRPVPGAGT